MRMRAVQFGLAGMMVLVMLSIASAQKNVPTPVVRLGDSIEIADDVWVNIIGAVDIRYQTTHNPDFEGDIRDRPPARNNQSTTPHGGVGDIMYIEGRIGFDFRYRKHLRMQIIAENQQTLDGNRVDNGTDLDGDTPTDQVFDDGRNLSCNAGGSCLQRNTFNLERAWIDYRLQGTPLRFRVGYDLWFTDPGGVIGDDDPRFAMFATFGPLEVSAAAVIQTTGLRFGLTNDNNDVYYNFGLKYDLKPFRIGLDTTYFRFRAGGATGRAQEGQEIDTVLIRPSITGKVGIFSGLIQPMFIFGSVDSPTQDYDVKSFGFIGQVEANLGRFRPFLAVVYGSGDDNPDDNDLEGFAPLPQREITLTTATSYFSVLTSSSSWGGRDVFPPAATDLGGGFEFLHSVGNPFSDRVGNGLNPGVSTTYSNPGVLLLAPGVKVSIVKGHNLDLYYIYRRVMETESIERELLNREGVAVSVDETMTHELAGAYNWAPSPYFDFRVFGAAVIPGAGVKDIASAQVCNNATGARCKGDDVALHGELRFRARF